MIRVTFVTGAGKLGRSRYDDNCAKTVTSTLRDLGYVEDRGASCVNECAGSFKSQHDTGKNLKTIVVFPKIVGDIANDMAAMALGSEESRGPPVLEEGSQKHLIAMSSMNIFENGVRSKCPGWSQKKSMVAVIGEIKNEVVKLDKKLLSGTPLTDSEQDFYDSCDLSSLERKEAHVKAEMAKQVDEKRLTVLEKRRLLAQVEEKLNGLEKEIQDAAENNKPKKLEKLKTQREKLTQRQNTLGSISPVSPPPLRFQAEINKLRKEMQPLLKMERDKKGQLLSVKETKTLARKDEIEEEILNYEEMSRGWFEDDEDFELRVDASRKQAKSMAAAKSTKKKPSSSARPMTTVRGGAKKPVTNWVVPTATKQRVGRATGKKTTSSQQNTFAAMMMDSDSDSD